MASAVGTDGRTYISKTEEGVRILRLPGWSSRVNLRSYPLDDLLQQMRMLGNTMGSFILWYLNRLKSSWPAEQRKGQFSAEEGTS